MEGCGNLLLGMDLALIQWGRRKVAGRGFLDYDEGKIPYSNPGLPEQLGVRSWSKAPALHAHRISNDATSPCRN